MITVARLVVAYLFPRRPAETVSPTTVRDSIVPDVQAAEFQSVIARCKNKAVAPGSDGVSLQTLMSVLDTLMPHICAFFTSCLKHGIFPLSWKIARLVLLRKSNKPLDPSA